MGLRGGASTPETLRHVEDVSEYWEILKKIIYPGAKGPTEYSQNFSIRGLNDATSYALIFLDAAYRSGSEKRINTTLKLFTQSLLPITKEYAKKYSDSIEGLAKNLKQYLRPHLSEPTAQNLIKVYYDNLGLKYEDEN